MNKVLLIGRLGQIPEAKVLPSGITVTNLSVATNSAYVKKDGEKKAETEWHRVVVFGKSAENCAQYLSKGSHIFVEGANRTRSYEDKDGIKKYTTEVVASTVIFLDTKGDSSRQKQPDIGEPSFDSNEELPF